MASECDKKRCILVGVFSPTFSKKQNDRFVAHHNYFITYSENLMAEKKDEGFTEIALNHIWRERIQREMKNYKLSTHFHANAETLEVVSDKPNQRKKRFLDRDQALLESLQEKKQNGQMNELNDLPDELLQNPEVQERIIQQKELNESIKKNEGFKQTLQEKAKLPCDRYKKPMTSSQMVGWWSKPLHQSKRFYYPRNQCEETIFANHVIKFSNQNTKEAK